MAGLPHLKLALLLMLASKAGRGLRTDGTSSTTSGFYFDNGENQTVAEVMSLEEHELLKEEMLALLGMTYASDRSIHKIDLRMLGNKTRSHFMRDIYNSLMLHEGADSGGELKEDLDPEDLLDNPFVITREDVRAIEESDVIISFANNGRQEDMQFIRLFWFDTSELSSPQDEEVLKAELRLHKGPAAAAYDPNDEVEVRLYQQVPGSRGEEERLDTKHLKFSHQGWFSLDLTKALKAWQLDSKTNLGLMVEIWRKDSSEQLRHSLVGLSGNRIEDPEHEAFMVGFFVGRFDNPLHRRNLRLKRSSSSNGEKRAAKSSSSGNSKRTNSFEADFSHFSRGLDNPYRDFYGGKARNRHCQRRGFRVSFKDLGWEDWIIAPDDYEAFYCHGECTFPSNTHMNATNHAIVQTLVHLMNPHKFPKPSCTPTKLSAIQVLYFDESSNVILKKYNNMVVKSCGCH